MWFGVRSRRSPRRKASPEKTVARTPQGAGGTDAGSNWLVPGSRHPTVVQRVSPTRTDVERGGIVADGAGTARNGAGTEAAGAGNRASRTQLSRERNGDCGGRRGGLQGLAPGTQRRVGWCCGFATGNASARNGIASARAGNCVGTRSGCVGARSYCVGARCNCVGPRCRYVGARCNCVVTSCRRDGSDNRCAGVRNDRPAGIL